jgi:hypothetical protein
VLTITIDVVPGGFAPARRTIATMRIANVSDLADLSDYSIQSLESANPLSGAPARLTECSVTGHDRRQSVWALLEAAAAEIQKSEPVEL